MSVNQVHQELSVFNQLSMNQQQTPQQPMQQQMYSNQQYDGYNPAMQQKNKMIPIILGAVVLVAIALIVIFISNLMNNEDNDGGLLKGNDNSYKVNYNGFDFNVPTNLIYEVTTRVLQLIV